MSQHDHNDSGHGKGPHVVSLGMLAAVLAILLVLTGLTVWTGNMDLHGLDLSVAMIIATIKATLVCLIFMHLKWDRRFNGMVFLFAVILVGLFLAFMVLDLNQYQPNVHEYRLQQLK